MEFWSVIGILAVVYVGFRFLTALGHRVPILELLLLIAGMQWIIGPIIEYQNTFTHFKYHMYIPEDIYVGYVVPAYLVLALAMFYGIYKEPKLNIDEGLFQRYSSAGVYILLLGIAFGLLKRIMPDSLSFVFYLLENFKYVGALILLFSDKRWHRYLFYAAILFLFIESIRSALFHDFILWSTFFFMFWAYKVKPAIRTTLIIMVSGFLLATGIQLVKADFRTLVWNGYSGNKLELFFDILTRKISGGFTEDKEEQGEMNVRLNQGWIISAIMKYTPEKEPYAYGETVVDAVYASILPRFLIPGKEEAGGVENFEKFTGLYLSSGTSMGMSVVGEAYANYGVFGGIVFMAIFGVVLILFWRLILKWVVREPLILFFIPLFWLQVVKAETELVVVLNHMVKSLLLVFLFFWVCKNILNWHFSDE
ncbi:hypothetical protein [Aequorivita lipolytica]|uniref:Oligosaccharide repeat unit polymerase n=1 Tax=Aequorivita lipolytica TaxID=153267 RepID=A0A5C6YNF9_9FLAO|nr:hypothetical protein [Aequorivita lipolytica]TXD68589.1 hypothetical protein ESV24_11800 [Aequorivita lipolytica]SRX53260.1 hypothetical protein AEQU2_02489 [Aequorivita lipolytica]